MLAQRGTPLKCVVDVGHLDVVDDTFDHAGVEVGFVAHVGVERHDFEAELRCEVSHREFRQAVASSDANCCVDDRLSRELRSSFRAHELQNSTSSVQCTENISTLYGNLSQSCL